MSRSLRQQPKSVESGRAGAVPEVESAAAESVAADGQLPDFRFEVCVDDITPFSVEPELPIREVVRQIDPLAKVWPW